jgi:5-methylcytosine-specific restriction endonuclease McrA
MHLPNYPSLVLNADFQPVRIHPLSTWGFERTMSAVMRDRVVVLEEYDVELHSANLTYKPPSVVALKRYIHIPERVAFNRLNIFLRDDFTCQYCGQKFGTKDLTFDHVIPRARGGRNVIENVVAACMPCNSRKGDKLIKPLREPRQPDPREMARKAHKVKGELHSDWLSYLYWSGVLEQDD